MTQEGIVNLPNINFQPPIQPSHFPAQGEPLKASDVEIENGLQSCSNISGHCQENVIMNPAESESDEVQFVFSVPRRKKRKRKRVGSTSKASSVMRDSEMSVSPPASRPTSASTSSQTIRRGSTGMVQQLDLCNMSENTQLSVKSGSLPTIARTSQPHMANPQFVASPSSDMLLQYPATLPIAEAQPWWTIQTPLIIQETGSFQFDICGMPFAEEVLKKRKHDDGPEDLVLEHGSSQWSQNKQNATQINPFLEPAAMTPTWLNEESSGANANSNPQNLVRAAETQTASRLVSPSGLPSNFIRPQNLASIARDVSSINPLECQLPQKQPWQGLTSGQQYYNECAQQQIIQVPVSLVPELSVSPRTKTIQVFRPVNPVQAQLQKISSKVPMTPRAAPQVPPSEQSSTDVNTLLMSLNCHGINSNISRQNRFPFLQTIPNDVQRKPSLYKIPAWPSPPISSIAPPYTSGIHSDGRNEATNSSLKPTQLLATQNTVHLAGVGTMHTETSPREKAWTSACIPANVILVTNNNGKKQISNAVPGTPQSRTAVSTRQVSPTPSSTTFSSRVTVQTSPSTRKNSPNLIVDIAETCQEHFPFAAVAKRHKQPIQKVFDTFSAIIQLPLLRSAADNRRHGDLAKTRMKEFRDAKKAMEKAQELERKKVSREVGKTESGDLPVQKASKKVPGLLKAAILNNARGKEGEMDS